MATIKYTKTPDNLSRTSHIQVTE